MHIDTQNDHSPVVSAVLADDDTSTTFFAVGNSLEANKYMEVEALFVLYAGASNVGKTATITFLTKDTDDGAVGTWTEEKVEAAVSIADAAGTYVVSARLHTREFAGKYANAKVVLAHADCGADLLVGSLILTGISDHRV